jgi:hypothetical protein
MRRRSLEMMISETEIIIFDAVFNIKIDLENVNRLTIMLT